MDGVSSALARDHGYCDALLADVEAAVAASDWARAEAFYPAFRAAMARHVDRVESGLFAAFEAATGSTVGPTRALCSEHGQMRALIDALGEALRARAREACLGHAETLVWLMCEHNLKEETILRGMAGREPA